MPQVKILLSALVLLFSMIAVANTQEIAMTDRLSEETVICLSGLTRNRSSPRDWVPMGSSFHWDARDQCFKQNI